MRGINSTWRVGRHHMTSHQQLQAAIQNSLPESNCPINSRLDNKPSPDLTIYLESGESNQTTTEDTEECLPLFPRRGILLGTGCWDR